MKKEINRQVIARLLTISATFLLGCQANACDSNLPAQMEAQADIHIKQNQPAKAYELMMSQARDGSGGAYRYIATMHERGRGVEKNNELSREMYMKGAELNDPEALFKVAEDFYARGFKVDGEYFAKRSIDCGHKGAVALLLKNMIKEEGRESEARALLEAGIEDALPEVKFIMAELYEGGRLGLPLDAQRAFAWYYLAAKEGDPKAMSAVAYYFFKGIHGVQDDLAALHWYHKASLAGDADAITAYAWMLQNNRGSQADQEEVVGLYKKAQALGNEKAAFFLSQMQMNSAVR